MTTRKKSTPVRAGSIITNALEALGLGPALARHKVVNMWPRIVHSAIAKHAHAERLSGSTLYVAVDSSVWMNELAAIKPVLLKKVNACLGPDAAPITDIKFSLKSDAGCDRQEPPILEPPDTDEEEPEATRELLELVKEDELREVFRKIMKKDRRLQSRRESAQ
ncbi:MAG: DUF721 domain-containing protein [Thermodesulfobacteriota bacterium]